MTEKEKAKAYDEAIERAKKLYSNGIAEDIFPELKDSDDERIRKNCIHFLELQKQHHAATFEIEECIDWLEKQELNRKNTRYMRIDYEIGKVFEFNGVKLKVVIDDSPSLCEGCYFYNRNDFCHNMKCKSFDRTDTENVIFKEIKE